MKKTFFVFLIFLSSLSFGQTYFSFPDSGAIWREHYYDYDSQDHYQFGILGDTVLQTLLYHKLYYQQSCLNDTAITSTNALLIGAIREDSLKRVFFYDLGFWGGAVDSIYKLYDFSAQVGDTIKFNPYYSGIFPYLILDSIDSVWAYDHYRKRYHLQQETWIEGIGSLRSLLSGVMGYPTCFCVWENVCFKEQNITYYLNPPFLDCYDMTYGVYDNNKPEEKIRVYPNPITSLGTIDFSELSYQPAMLEVFNILGEKVREYKVTENKKIIIDRTEYNSGLYIYKLTTMDRISLNGKFLIE